MARSALVALPEITVASSPSNALATAPATEEERAEFLRVCIETLDREVNKPNSELRLVTCNSDQTQYPATGTLGEYWIEIQINNAPKHGDVVLDLRGIPYLSSRTIALILRASHEFENQGRLVFLKHVHPDAAETIQALGLDRKLSLAA